MRNEYRRRNERGEGVISLAIGVLIMAFLGAGMWLAFNATMSDAQDTVDDQIGQIGNG
jgi:4-hydroxybenzoate polyprenyltransferase